MHVSAGVELATGGWMNGVVELRRSIGGNARPGQDRDRHRVASHDAKTTTNKRCATTQNWADQAHQQLAQHRPHAKATRAVGRITSVEQSPAMVLNENSQATTTTNRSA